MTSASPHRRRRPPAASGARQDLARRRLERALRAEVEGEVRFDPGSLALYANDASNFRQVPVGVVVPRSLEDVVATHRVCRRFDVPLLNRGGGTSLSGETVNEAVVIDHSKYLTRIGDFDPERRLVTCETGVVNEELNRHTGAAGLVFGPDPSSHSRCVIGGNIGNNSCGTHSLQSQLYGPGPRTSDNVHALEVVTYDGVRFWTGTGEEERLADVIRAGGRKGEIYAALRDLRDRYAGLIRERFRPVSEVPRRVSGYNLDELLPERGFNVARALTGTEGTCVTVLRAVLLLTPALPERALVVVEYGDLAEAGEPVAEIVERWRPIGLEAVDHRLVRDQRLLGMNAENLPRLPRPGGGAWLLVQFGADEPREAVERAGAFADWLTAERGVARERVTRAGSAQLGGSSEALWSIRESGLGSSAFSPEGVDHWPGWEDSAVPPARVGAYLRELRALLDRHGLSGAMYGHLGQGCIHCRLDFDLRSAAGLARYRAFLTEAADLVVSHGGSLSGEHGDGQQRAELLDKQYGPELVEAMREFKRIWDPRGRMNPGKVVDPYRMDENLRLGTDSNPPRPAVTFAYPEDGGDFAHAALRCVGIGKCRVPRAETTMCPSYQVTREEKHSTRGRARLLFEMLRGEVITDGWQSREVAEALDLCLSCKGCTSDCPVGVDMPTYKAEFRHRHYRSLRRWRPRHAYALGFVDQAARLAALLPEAAALLTRTPGLARLTKLAAGIDPRRPLPGFAPTTLQQWFRRRGGSRNPQGRPVVLFPDTFTNHLHTDVGVACVEAVEAAGWRVLLPAGHLCCGRPLYDYGFLDAAVRYLHRVLGALRPYVRAGVPVVGMEPSCLAVFKDELGKLLPHDDDAARLAGGSYHFPEFFRAFGIEPPPLTGRALLWGHCHHRATGGMEPERALLERMGLRVEPVTGGCCGLAGSWGFESGTYGISMDCGEQALFPAVREAAADTLVVADGFSCRTQLAHAAPGPAPVLHTGQVLRLATAAGGVDEVRARPGAPLARRAARVALAAGAVAAAGAGRARRRP
ncbi:FAD-binding and (Fe-S)-binding domain-containing protein [Streptomyces hoynatensis]|uniref:FAD-binding oxidoreductase n=1 Tax=Streptomyces hoynatensis TaxID=1141874 RepID=A0A3A9YSR4_9ACTN|nr:FAD-binding and (Fe-S)-binding domain-containing protein [Streptomyces hoynatensis]RKN39005.1 FAD-binding oxidoreductase [Streptomyces hoynatensis]